jgi:hypothetical protein
MQRIDIDAAIHLHTRWRRQFLNAFAGGAYADMPLSEHRSCTLATALNAASGAYTQSIEYRELQVAHQRFHNLANEIVELSNNGLSDSADLLLPELSEACHQVVAGLDRLREMRSAEA